MHQVAKVLELQLQHQPFQWILRTDFLEDGLVGSPCSSEELSSIFSNTTVQKHQFAVQPSLWSNSHIHHDYWKGWQKIDYTRDSALELWQLMLVSDIFILFLLYQSWYYFESRSDTQGKPPLSLIICHGRPEGFPVTRTPLRGRCRGCQVGCLPHLDGRGRGSSRASPPHAPSH